MASITLTGTIRKHQGRSVKKLRAEGFVPANIFGKSIKSQSIQTNSKEFLKLYRQVGESTLLNLKIAEEKQDRPVFIRDVTVHPVSGNLLHVSFHQVDLKEKITAPVPLVMVGDAPAEKEKLGILVQQLDEVEISALPVNIPVNIQVEVSSLAEVGSQITVADLKVDTSKLEIKTDPDQVIVRIEPLAKEEPVEAPAAAPETASTGETASTETPAAAPETPEAKSS